MTSTIHSRRRRRCSPPPTLTSSWSKRSCGFVTSIGLFFWYGIEGFDGLIRFVGFCLVCRFLWNMWDLWNPEPYVVSKTGEIQREIRPIHSVLGHVLLFRWIRPILGDGTLFQHVLIRLNRGVMTWDRTFEERGEEPERWVLDFCQRWGIPTEPWIWEKKPNEFRTPNDFFARTFHPNCIPNIGRAIVVSPATAVVSWYERACELPKRLKNDDWSLKDVGIPNYERYLTHPATILYLAPQDYHRFHVPIDGVVERAELLNQDRYSVTVKPYIFKDVNILTRNRRAVIVLRGKELRVAVVVVGGITVDSIRIDDAIRVGADVRKGQMLGNFARGGSSICMLFDVLRKDRDLVRDDDLVAPIRSDGRSKTNETKRRCVFVRDNIRRIQKRRSRSEIQDVKVEVGQSLAHFERR